MQKACETYLNSRNYHDFYTKISENPERISFYKGLLK